MNIAEFRIKLNMSQVELAEKVGVSKNYINMIERGKCIPSVGVLAHLAVVLEVCPCMIMRFKKYNNC